MRLPLVALLAVTGCGALWPRPVTPRPSALAVAQSVVADSAVVRVRCSVPANATCRWSASVGGQVRPVPDGLEARLAFVAPEPGDSVLVYAGAQALRRGLLSTETRSVSVWVRRPDVPPLAPDSVWVVEVTVP